MVRTLKRPDTASIDPYKSQPLPLGKPVSVYYRQSSEGQIGNISTTLQTVDMVEHLIAQGWQREQIHMIDMDAGISGQKKISERPGMSFLYRQIEHGEIGLVAAQDVDRFFRDLTQIETNIFIDACRRNNVQVLTPTFVYDFAHPTQGRYHMQLFRDQAQRAADFIEYHVRGRLVKSRHWRKERGLWAGRPIAPGFMVDMRETLTDGSRNPDWRKYRRFDLYADVLLAYFERFHANEGNLQQTWRQIEAEGPYFPDLTPGMVPGGFKATAHLERRSRRTGGLTPSFSGLQHLLVNVAYIGHWVHKGVIAQWHNHEAIIPNDLFMYAYNRISSTDFYGEPNPQYVPYRPWTRHNKAERAAPPPTYADLIYSDDVPDLPHKRLAAIWSVGNGNYKYQLYHTYRSNVWNINAAIVDAIVDRLLLERLQVTTIDPAVWQAALASVAHGDHAEVRRLETAVKQAENAKDNLIASLTTLSHAEMIERAEARYVALEHEIAALQAELARMKAGEKQHVNLETARPVLELVIAHWADVPRQERRDLFEAFASHISMTKVTRHTKRITIHWRDGSTTTESTTHRSTGYFWEDDDLEQLRTMIEDNVDQVDILRAFPDYRWRALTQRMRYHFGKGWWKSYTGAKKYPRDTTWADTEEAQAEAQQLKASRGCTDEWRLASFVGYRRSA
ncbi:MAG: recombinase family protein [Anaerolineaceae bacterium]|nr:recombinase family protein [Anaerolineaceae bacterium]